MPPWHMAISRSRTASDRSARPVRQYSYQKKRKIGAFGFRRLADAAMSPVDLARQRVGKPTAHLVGNRGTGRGRREPARCRTKRAYSSSRRRACWSRRRARLPAPAEGGPAVARLGRKIGAAPERRAIRRDEHGERPAALLSHAVQRRHVDVVDVGTFLPVDLHVDEIAVHQRGGRLVLEALVRHHVAPVAGGVADRQDRAVEPARLLERGAPQDRQCTGLSARAAAGRARSRGRAGFRAEAWQEDRALDGASANRSEFFRVAPRRRRSAPRRRDPSTCGESGRRKGLLSQRRRHVERPLVERRAAVGAHAGLREGGDLAGERHRCHQRLAGGDDAVGKTEGNRLVGRRPGGPSGSCRRARLADHTRQADRNRHRSAARPSASSAEDRRGRRHAQIAHQRQFRRPPATTHSLRRPPILGLFTTRASDRAGRVLQDRAKGFPA